MQTAAGPFNSHVTPAQIQRNSFVTRLYGQYNNRGPFLYPRSPYSLGDIAPMASMAPINDDTLFTTLPMPGEIATSTAPIGSAGYPTFQATAPATPGTVLGPAGATVPEFSPLAQLAAANPDSYTSPYGTPAASPDQAIATGQPAGPITYTSAFPSIVQPPPVQTAAQPSLLCEFGAWVQANPGLALLGTVGVYFLLRGKKR